MFLFSYFVFGLYVSRLLAGIRRVESKRFDEFCGGVRYASKDVRNKMIIINQVIYLFENMGDSIDQLMGVLKSNIKGAMELLDDLVFEDEVVKRLFSNS